MVFLYDMILLFPLVLALLTSVRGQDFSIPSDWRKPTSNRTHSERLSIAQTAVSSLVPMIHAFDGTVTPPMDDWSDANVVAGLAQHEYITKTQNNHELVRDTIMGFRKTHDKSYFDNAQPLKGVTSDALIWGLASFYGARAYNDSHLLKLAADVWNVGQVFSVSEQDAASGTQRTRSTNFTVNCIPNVTSVGAVFSEADNPSNLYCTGGTIGAYLVLSAHLWESTANTTYLNAAEQSASFMYTHMYSQSSNAIVYNYDLGSCSVDATQLYSYDQGYFLEGLSMLSSAPVSDNAAWTNLMQTLVVSTVQSPMWTTINGTNAGVLTENDSCDPTTFQEAWVYRNAYTRALYEVWSRTNPSSPMANLIQAFMTVQYNALLDLASDDGDFYSPVWTGPPIQSKVPWGQISALEVLNAAVGMSPADNSSSVTSSAPASKTLAPGAIAGIVVGAVAGVAFLVLVPVLCIIRRRTRRGNEEEPHNNSGEVDPFPPGLPVTRQGHTFTLTGLTSKDRRGHGLGYSESSGSQTPTPEVVEVASTLAERPAALPPAESPFTVLTRMIQETRTQHHEPPPSYYTTPE